MQKTGNELWHGCLGLPGCSHLAKQPCKCPCHKAETTRVKPEDIGLAERTETRTDADKESA